MLQKQLGDGQMGDLFYSNKREILFFLVLVFCGLTMCWAYRDGRLNETIYIQIEKNKPTIHSETTQTITELEKIYAPTEYVYDENLLKTETYVKQEGVAGDKTVTVMSVYVDGEEVDEKIIEAEVITEAVPRIVYVGTKEPETFICPLREGYVITSSYGWRWGRSHDGIDLAIATGTPVYASATGTVVMAQWYYGYGKCIDIEHENGTVTRYAHLSSIDVSVGEQVFQGMIIGESGNTGNSTGPHLHFEIIVDGAAVDPATYIDM